MIEVALALGIGIALAAGAAVLALVAWESLLVLGTGLILVGLAVGVPAGLWYHVRLHRALAGVLPARWWLSPARYHERMTPAQRPGVLRPFFVGAGGFVVILLGVILATAGALRGR